jgi:hypothetical protein
MDVAFHIGYHKTATSWLQQTYFPNHPEIQALCDSRAPWNDPFLSYLIGTPDSKFDSQKCARILRETVSSSTDSGSKRSYIVSAERLSGHPISGGFDNFRIAERIYSIAPQAKIIIVVREQTKMISSVYKQMVGEGYPGHLEDMLSWKRWKATGFDLSYFEYDLLVSKYFSLFGKQNVLTLPYELMRKDRETFLQLLCQFIGISEVSPLQGEKLVNASLPNSSLPMIRRLNYFRRTELYPYPQFNIPGPLFSLIGRAFVKMSQLWNTASDVMTDDQKARVSEYYIESNEKLSDLVGIKFDTGHR